MFSRTITCVREERSGKRCDQLVRSRRRLFAWDFLHFWGHNLIFLLGLKGGQGRVPPMLSATRELARKLSVWHSKIKSLCRGLGEANFDVFESMRSGNLSISGSPSAQHLRL